MNPEQEWLFKAESYPAAQVCDATQDATRILV